MTSQSLLHLYYSRTGGTMGLCAEVTSTTHQENEAFKQGKRLFLMTNGKSRYINIEMLSQDSYPCTHACTSSTQLANLPSKKRSAFKAGLNIVLLSLSDL